MTIALVAVIAAATAGAVTLNTAGTARWSKMTASTGFVGLAVVSGALDSSFGVAILTGLVLAWVGDLALSYRGTRAFVIGLAAFLAGHVAYIVAFAIRGLDGDAALVAAVVMIGFAAAVVWWLLPHVGRSLRMPVLAYIVVISAMVVFAAGSHGSEREWRLLAGAVLFTASDLFVARERFVAPGRENRMVGLPLYYAAQTVLAVAAGG